MTSHRFGFSILLGLLVLLPSACQQADESPAVPATWPPEVGQTFPDMTVLDHEGQKVALSSFKGRVLLFEPIGMNCPACIGFCGGAEYGAFDGAQPQAGLGSIAENFERFAGGVDIDDENIAVIQMLFFSGSMKTPTQAEAQRWAEHFQIERHPNHYVVIGPEALRQKTYDSIPGYWLVDRNFVLQCDATGHHPASNLYTDLLPMVPKLLRVAAGAPR